MVDTPNVQFAYIMTQDGKFFQVLNADQTDWDEAATAAAYNAYLTSQGVVS